MTAFDFIRRLGRVSRWALVAALALLSLGASSAWAETFDKGQLAAGQTYSFSNSAPIGIGLSAPGAEFTDSLTFSLGSNLGLNSQVGMTALPGVILLSNVTVNLFANGNPVALFQGINGATTGTVFTNAFTAPSLAPGNYTLVVSGFGSGSLGGSYTGSITAVPALAVPEAPAWMSMLAGLALLGTLAGRRLRSMSTHQAVEHSLPQRAELHPDKT